MKNCLIEMAIKLYYHPFAIAFLLRATFVQGLLVEVGSEGRLHLLDLGHQVQGGLINFNLLLVRLRLLLKVVEFSHHTDRYIASFLLENGYIVVIWVTKISKVPIYCRSPEMFRDGTDDFMETNKNGQCDS